MNVIAVYTAVAAALGAVLLYAVTTDPALAALGAIGNALLYLAIEYIDPNAQ